MMHLDVHWRSGPSIVVLNPLLPYLLELCVLMNGAIPHVTIKVMYQQGSLPLVQHRRRTNIFVPRLILLYQQTRMPPIGGWPVVLGKAQELRGVSLGVLLLRLHLLGLLML
jgi:hypothetical protein